MMHTKTGRRVVLIGRTPTTITAGGPRAMLDRQRATHRRIVVIKDGQFVGGRPAR
jgi:hypothetical protein